jgi:hypothetical protein
MGIDQWPELLLFIAAGIPSEMLFSTFICRTVKIPASMFARDPGFSLMKLLSPDPLGILHLEEFVLWALLTLVLVSGFYFRSLFSGRKRVF